MISDFNKVLNQLKREPRVKFEGTNLLTMLILLIFEAMPSLVFGIIYVKDGTAFLLHGVVTKFL